MLNDKRRPPVPGPLCRSFAPLLAALDDLTDARLAEDTRAHLGECAWCRAQRASYDRLDEALRLHFAPDAPPLLPYNTMRSFMADLEDKLQVYLPDDDTGAGDESAVGDDDPRITILPLPPAAHASQTSYTPHAPKRSWRLATGAASLAAVLVISLLAGLIFVSHGRALPPASRKATATAQTPAPGSQTGLMAIGMSSPTDGWAMGTQMAANQDGGSSDDPAYVMHYTGGRWVEAQTPIHAWITAITMLSPSDGWAIGNRVYHYDGVSWREVTLPVATQYNAIAAVSPTNIWIAGDGSYTSALDGNVTILHYDGHTWTRQAAPHLLDYFSIASLSMVSAHEGWAVGSATLDGSKGWYPPTGAILHYLNGVWRLTKTLPGIELHTVSMGTSAAGWLGGDQVMLSKTGKLPADQSPGETTAAKLWRYTGGQWVEAPAPQVDQYLPNGQITNITMFSATQGWMAATLGDRIPSPGKAVPVTPDIFRLEQGRWVQIATPIIQQRRSAYLSQALFVSPDEFWGVGRAQWWTGIPQSLGGYRPTVTPLIVHYAHGAWSVAAR